MSEVKSVKDNSKLKKNWWKIFLVFISVGIFAAVVAIAAYEGKASNAATSGTVTLGNYGTVRKNQISSISKVYDESRDKYFYNTPDKEHDYIYLDWFTFKVGKQTFAYYMLTDANRLPQGSSDSTPKNNMNKLRNIFKNKKLGLQVLSPDSVTLCTSGYNGQLDVEDASGYNNKQMDK